MSMTQESRLTKLETLIATRHGDHPTVMRLELRHQRFLVDLGDSGGIIPDVFWKPLDSGEAGTPARAAFDLCLEYQRRKNLAASGPVRTACGTGKLFGARSPLASRAGDGGSGVLSPVDERRISPSRVAANHRCGGRGGRRTASVVAGQRGRRLDARASRRNREVGASPPDSARHRRNAYKRF